MEANFFLIIIQIIVKAAHFKFMVRNEDTPNIKKKMVAFQNDWGTISRDIHKVETETLKCIRIMLTLKLLKNS